MANPYNDEASVLDFMQQYEITTPTLLDSDEEIYSSYQRSPEGFAPYPLHVVIDKEQKITYLSYQSDIVALQAAIDRALAE